MLSISKVYKAIQEKNTDIQLLQKESKEAVNKAQSLIESLLVKDYEEINSLLQSRIIDIERDWIGALFTSEWKDRPSTNPPKVKDIQEWKETTLKNRITVAIDGSQILPDKNISLNIGAIQVGWYINHHHQNHPPVKDFEFSIETPDSYSTEYSLSQQIQYNRYNKEIQKAIYIMSELNHGDSYSQRPIIFLDGAMTLGYRPDDIHKTQSQDLINKLLVKSEEKKIPVIAYTDISQSTNLSNSLSLLLKDTNKSNDTNIYTKYTNQWGMRSTFFEYYDKSLVDSNIYFCYLNNSSYKVTPSRIEMPKWCYTDNLHNEIINVILAESIVGNGYPYSIEVADSVAVLKNKEKNFFYKYLESQIKDLKLNISPKQKSKINRRKNKISL